MWASIEMDIQFCGVLETCEPILYIAFGHACFYGKPGNARIGYAIIVGVVGNSKEKKKVTAFVL